MPAAMYESPCPQCGEPVSVTIARSETSDQLAAECARCPHCDAPLERVIVGHADRGWRAAEEAAE